MNISGILPNLGEVMNVKSADKSVNNLDNYHGPSFVESFRSVVQSANLQVADGNASAMLNLNRSKEEKLEKLFSFTESEEEILDESLVRIKKLLSELKK
jgi:hypothetical protein